MTKYRDRSWFFRVLSWKRLLLITCFAVAVVMIVRTPMNGPPKNEPSVIIDRLAVRDWDGDTVNLFKKQLGILNKSGKPTFSCKDLWEENNNYLIVTGFPSEDEEDLEAHLWLYLNLLSLEKFDSVQSPTLRLLLPSRTKAVLRKIFQNIQFGDLSNLLHCAEEVQLDRMLAKSRIVGHFEEISFNEQRTTENIQLVILNRDTKRVNELSRFDFSFLPYRPLFTQELMQKVRPLIAGLVNTGERAGDDNANPADVGTVSHNLIGVYIDERDNLPEILERIKIGMDYRRSIQEDSYFVVACAYYYKDDCLAHFTGEDILVTDFDTKKEEILALLSSCHGTIVSNEISLFGGLISNGDVALVNFTRGQNWLQTFVDNKEDWIVVDED